MVKPLPANQSAVQTIGERLVTVCLEILGRDAIQGIIVHGSAVKGGIIPGFSDFDAQVYLKPDQLGPYGIATDKVFAMQERVDGLGVREAGFSYMQFYLLDLGRMPTGWLGPIRGTYSVLYGTLPPGFEPSDAQLRENARKHMADARQLVASYHRDLPDSHNDMLPRRLRLLSTDTTPSVYAVISYDQEDASAIWAEDKFTALRRLRERYARDPGHQHALRFYDALLAIGASSPPPDVLRSALRNGIEFLKWVDELNSNVLARQRADTQHAQT